MANNKPQPQQSQMNHGDAKASMGIATFLQSHLLPQKQPGQDQAQAPQTPEIVPQPPTNQETSNDTANQMSGLEERIMSEIGALKEEIKKAQPQDSNKEIEALKKEIEQVLASND